MYFSADGVPKWSQTGYAYDGSGNVRSFGIWSAGGTSSSRQYTYDGLNRLAELYDGAAPPRSYAYDPYGNLTNFGGMPIVSNPATNRISSVRKGAGHTFTPL
jgi:YD repeat-containing protein